MDAKQAVAHADQALKMVSVNLPFLAGLAYSVEVFADKRVQTAGIFASGRLLVNPEWFGELSLADATFVMAHELLHLALRTHERASYKQRRLFNIAHDYIINDILKRELGLQEVPANGLDWQKDFQKYYKLENQPVESLIKFIDDTLSDRRKEALMRRPHWGASGEVEISGSELGDLLRDALAGKNKLHIVAPETAAGDLAVPNDVLTDELERDWFPGDVRKIKIRIEIIREKATESLALRAVDIQLAEIRGMGNQPGGSNSAYDAVQTLYTPPWESALQQWMEHTVRAGRTYARPSRRGHHREFVRPGANREGHTLHIVLDTSGSQTHILGLCLGVIARFCETMQVPKIHMIQCDTQIQDENWYTPEELYNFKVKGLGGSNMGPAMHQLASDPEVQHVLVITDGYISYPDKPMPYHVLWVLTSGNTGFKPGYGAVIPLTDQDLS